MYVVIIVLPKDLEGNDRFMAIGPFETKLEAECYTPKPTRATKRIVVKELIDPKTLGM